VDRLSRHRARPGRRIRRRRSARRFASSAPTPASCSRHRSASYRLTAQGTTRVNAVDVVARCDLAVARAPAMSTTTCQTELATIRARYARHRAAPARWTGQCAHNAANRKVPIARRRRGRHAGRRVRHSSSSSETLSGVQPMVRASILLGPSSDGARLNHDCVTATTRRYTRGRGRARVSSTRLSTTLQSTPRSHAT